ncbi:MAG TPA: DoxX family protein [Terrimicrobiaceae bacterium]
MTYNKPLQAAGVLPSEQSLPKMKKEKIIYWTSTGIVAGVMLWSGFNFAWIEKGAFAHFGLPDWFRIELTVAKIVGALVLLIPAIPHKIKEFAYFGFALTLISAPIAHLSSGDSIWLVIGHLTFSSILVVSYLYYYKTIVGKNVEFFRVS